jgi:hypothetical protein
MTLEDVITRFCNACNVNKSADVTRETAPDKGVTPVTPVTSALDNPEAKSGDGPVATLEWLESQGCQDVLPPDVAHIKRHLPRGLEARKHTLLTYVETWLNAADAEPLPHRKDNAGRSAANRIICQ